MKHSKKVTAIHRLQVEKASSIMRTGVATSLISDTAEWEKVCMKVPADLTVSSKTEDKQRIYTAKLTFSYRGERYDRGLYIYKVTLANGRNLLIGTGERPYPVCETSEEHPSSDSTSQLVEVTVTYSSPMEMPYV